MLLGILKVDYSFFSQALVMIKSNMIFLYCIIYIFILFLYDFLNNHLCIGIKRHIRLTQNCSRKGGHFL